MTVYIKQSTITLRLETDISNVEFDARKLATQYVPDLFNFTAHLTIKHTTKYGSPSDVPTGYADVTIRYERK